MEEAIKFSKKRRTSLVAGMLIEVLCGIAYAWSVFQTPMIAKFGWSIKEVSFAYTLMSLVGLLFSVFVGARLKRKLSTRTEVLIGSLLYGGGLILMRFMTGHIWELYLYFSVINIIGCTMVYPVLIPYALELYPERTGFAGGLMTAGYGLGAVLWAPVATGITNRTGDVGYAFLILGILFLVGMAALSQLLRTPPAGFREAMLARAGMQKTGKMDRGVVYQVNKSRMVKLPLFYLMMLCIIIILSCGAMIITQGSPILQLKFGMAPGGAAAIVGLLAVANTIGRVVWGSVSDKVGKTKTLLFLHMVMFVVMFLLAMINNQGLFTAVLLGTTFCYGGAACMVAPCTEELFGAEFVSENYSVSYAVYGIAGMLGPMIISSIRQSTGEYTLGFAVAAGLAAVGVLVTLALLRKAAGQRKRNAIRVMQ